MVCVPVGGQRNESPPVIPLPRRTSITIKHFFRTLHTRGAGGLSKARVLAKAEPSTLISVLINDQLPDPSREHPEQQRKRWVSWPDIIALGTSYLARMVVWQVLGPACGAMVTRLRRCGQPQRKSTLPRRTVLSGRADERDVKVRLCARPAFDPLQ
jgi:hypothetical protein